MISAGYTELRKAFLNHTKISDSGENDSHHLLLFYGLECGLKSIYLKRNRIYQSNQITDENLRSTHDLFLFIKNLRLPAQIAGASSPTFRLERDGTSLEIKLAHEAWRYGIMIRKEDAEKLILWMCAIHTWVKENI